MASGPAFGIGVAKMAGARDQKTNWNAGETIMWVRTRDYDRVADLWDASEFESISLAWFARDLLPKIPVRMTSDGSVVVGEASSPVPSEPELVTIPDPPVTTPPQPDQAMIVAWALAVAAVHHQRGPSASIDLPLDRILRELMKKVHTRRISNDVAQRGGAWPSFDWASERLGIPLTEDPLAPIIVWSQIHQEAVGTSPWFSRADVIRAWPERRKKTAAVDGAILRHLRQISTPEAPLTKDQAWKRCRDEVPNAYPAAFERAWLRLDPALKLRRGKHGIRTH
jgi:hypothetical protein